MNSFISTGLRNGKPIRDFLDTHVALWLYGRKGSGLSTLARQMIEESTILLISPMVLLELDYLHEIGRVTLPASPVFKYLRKKIGLQVCREPFIDIIREASKLNWTRDPFDRIIVSNAAINDAKLVTKDDSILEHYEYASW